MNFHILATSTGPAGHICTACPDHTTNKQGDTLGDSAAKTGCDCNYNYHVENDACVKCSLEGTTNFAGQDFLDGDTACTCRSNWFVKKGTVIGWCSLAILFICLAIPFLLLLEHHLESTAC
jgi:hypothetical protein